MLTSSPRGNALEVDTAAGVAESPLVCDAQGVHLDKATDAEESADMESQSDDEWEQENEVLRILLPAYIRHLAESPGSDTQEVYTAGGGVEGPSVSDVQDVQLDEETGADEGADIESQGVNKKREVFRVLWAENDPLGAPRYFVKWRGSGPEENDWADPENSGKMSQMIKEYERMNEPEMIEQYTVERILGCRRSKDQNGEVQYFVKWEGYYSSENSWVTEGDAWGMMDLVRKYWKEHQAAVIQNRPRSVEDDIPDSDTSSSTLPVKAHHPSTASSSPAITISPANIVNSPTTEGCHQDNKRRSTHPTWPLAVDMGDRPSVAMSNQPFPAPRRDTRRSKHRTKDIFSWVFKSEAVAPCFIRDIFELHKNEMDSSEFYWLGAVPCRSVKIVGLIVGVKVYEKRTLYTVDDGTGVIDSAHLTQEPLPTVRVGQFVQVTGVVRPQYKMIARSLVVNQIALCSSPNDELFHTKVVRELHRTLYSSTHDFVIPTSTDTLYLQTAAKKVPNPPNPMLASPPSSVSTSPIKEPLYISPTKKVPREQSLNKLRHPSRLHTTDLTPNTFRLYLKYYVDAAHNDNSADSIPTSPSRYQSCNDATPRRIPRMDSGLGASTSRSSPSENSPSRAKPAPRKGFTLSYLRRVPELRLLASRVVDAVSKRRVRADLKKLKESGLPLPHPAPSAQLSPAQKRKRMKELFRWAILKHLRDGCLFIWGGPMRGDIPASSMSRLWKANAPASTRRGDNTLFGSTLESVSAAVKTKDNDEDEGGLSDPDSGEEGYISLSPRLVADHVEDVIRTIVKHKEDARQPYAGATKAEILNHLKNDDHWKHLDAWTVDDALKALKEENRAWQMGKEEKWELTE